MPMKPAEAGWKVGGEGGSPREKGRALAAKREKGKRHRARGFELIPTLLPGRAHARPNRNRNRFPGWSHPPTFDNLIICPISLAVPFRVSGNFLTLKGQPASHFIFFREHT